MLKKLSDKIALANAKREISRLHLELRRLHASYASLTTTASQRRDDIQQLQAELAAWKKRFDLLLKLTA